MKIEENASLYPHNTFKIDRRAAQLVTLQHLKTLPELTTYIQKNNVPIRVIGGGSNLLFTEDFSGLIVLNTLKGIEVIEDNQDIQCLKIAAGENWHQLVTQCVQRGLGGIENLALIPGTVGATPIQNIGAYGVEIGTRIQSVEAWHFPSNRMHTLTQEDCQFQYRDSVFKHLPPDTYCICAVTLQLNKKPQLNTHYPLIREHIEKNQQTPTLQSIYQAICEIRTMKLPDPVTTPNAGSFFKNPIVDWDTLNQLQEQFPKLPKFKHTNNTYKLSAGWLIEQAGMKGYSIGDAGVSKQHALVITNRNDRTGESVYAVAQAVQHAVKQQFNIQLTPEVTIL